MSFTRESKLANADVLHAEIDKLIRVEPTESPFLSCYLDTRHGKDECKTFIEEAASSVRRTLEVVSRFEFDNALNMVREQIDSNWNSRAQGLAIFARGIAGGRFLSTLHLADTVPDSFVSYRTPEIVPLLAQRERASGFTLLALRGSGIQVTDVDSEGSKPAVWAAIASDGLPRQNVASRLFRRLDRRLRAIGRALAARSGSPLVVAGSGDRVDRMTECLPGRVRARGVEKLVLPESLAESDFVERARAHWMATRRVESAQFATRLLRVLRPRGLAVAGPVATEQALRENNADILVISESPSNLADCRWDARIELSRLAWRQGIPIVTSESSELQYAGGMACVLRQRGVVKISPVPVSGLPRVA